LGQKTFLRWVLVKFKGDLREINPSALKKQHACRRLSLEVVSKTHLRPNGCVAPQAGFASDFLDSGAAQPPINAHIPMYAALSRSACALMHTLICLDQTCNPAQRGFDAHINLLKSRRVIPRSGGKPDLRF